MTFKKFNKEDYTWEGVERLIYKEDRKLFKDVTRQVLFDGAFDIPCQLRYFEVGPGGHSTLEHHEHTHMVMIYRGKGECLIGKEIRSVEKGDMLVIPSHVVHQFRANQGEYLGFLCLVNIERDKVTLPTEKEIEELKKDEYIRRFFEA